jgi:tetratricopeptide (TPR) repeat protein
MEDPIMRRVCFLLCIAVILTPEIWGQGTAQEQFQQGYFFVQKGQFDSTIRTLEPITDSAVLSPLEKGRAFILLGYAYRETGQYQRSEHAYERALQLLAGDSQNLSEYANALDCLAGLYRSTGRGREASSMWARVLDIYRHGNNHRSAVRVYANLAGLAMEQKHRKAAKEALASAIAESKIASNLTDDDFALISEIQASIASAEGDDKAAIAAYQHVVDLRKQGHGEYFPLTGWSYLILGRAYAVIGNAEQALANMHEGLDILERTEGRQAPRYLVGEVFYSQALDMAGSHEEAARLKGSAQQSLKDLYRGQCLGCTVSASSFR